MVTPENKQSSSPLRNSAFVGRQREMGELAGALEDVLSGSGASNIFSKIGVTNRTEAATYATRHSLA